LHADSVYLGASTSTAFTGSYNELRDLPDTARTAIDNFEADLGHGWIHVVVRKQSTSSALRARLVTATLPGQGVPQVPAQVGLSELTLYISTYYPSPAMDPVAAGSGFTYSGLQVYREVDTASSPCVYSATQGLAMDPMVPVAWFTPYVFGDYVHAVSAPVTNNHRVKVFLRGVIKYKGMSRTVQVGRAQVYDQPLTQLSTQDTDVYL
jgi:hypothetical protein